MRRNKRHLPPPVSTYTTVIADHIFVKGRVDLDGSPALVVLKEAAPVVPSDHYGLFAKISLLSSPSSQV